MKATPIYSFAFGLTDNPRQAVAVMRDAESERVAELRENRRGKGLPAEPTDQQIMQIWSDRRLN